MDDRRYNEQEVAEVFGCAAEAQGGRDTCPAARRGDDARGAAGHRPAGRHDRQWTNGNLQVLVEPTEHGDRLRMRTVNANAQMAIFVGIGVIAVPARVVAVAAVAGVPNMGERISSLAPMALMGAASLGVGLARLRGWARTREQ